ncbi:MAG: gas vesicle protein [Chloroflexota bacterium]|nr:gas vesicle protein [Chloroflexota bacterium]
MTSDQIANRRNDPPYAKPIEPDWFLQQLVGLVNRVDIEFGITLCVGGGLVSGTLVGGAKYFEGFGDDIEDGFTEAFGGEEERPIARDIANQFRQHADLYSQHDAESDIADRESDQTVTARNAPPRFVHLSSARFFFGEGEHLPTNRGVWWRGRLDAVEGFSLGVLSVDA